MSAEKQSDRISSVLSTSLSAAVYLSILQLFARVLTFAMNQLVLRYITPAVFGLASIQMELLAGTILFFSREAFRSALLRASLGIEPEETVALDDNTEDNDDDDEDELLMDDTSHTKSRQSTLRKRISSADQDTDLRSPRSGRARALSDFHQRQSRAAKEFQKLVNLSYIPVGLGVLISILVGLYFIYINPSGDVRFYVPCVIICTIGTFIEILVEPIYIIAQNRLYLRLRVFIEAAAVFINCATILFLTWLGEADTPENNHLGVLAFAWGRVALSSTLAIGYISFIGWKTWKSIVNNNEQDIDSLHYQHVLVRPIREIDSKSRNVVTYYFDPKLLNLAKTFMKQSIMKQFLTEGDKIILSFTTTAYEQGVYAFVVNYGSLVVRILFFPLEETGRLIFSKLLADMPSRHSEPIPNSHLKTASSWDISKSKSRMESLKTTLNLLHLTIKFHIILGLLFICFGTNYTSLLIDLLTGPSWSHHTQAPLTLAIYCLYVPIMGVNGITEAFVQSVATENDLQSQSLAMAFFSLLFGISGIVLLKWLKVGAVGLVLANMINLSGRIGWSWQFIGRYFTEKWSILEKRRGKNEHVGIEMGKIIPNSNVLTTFVLSWAATKYSEQVIGWESMEQKVKHIGVGIGCLLLCSLVLLQRERQFLTEIIELFRSKSRPSETIAPSQSSSDQNLSSSDERAKTS